MKCLLLLNWIILSTSKISPDFPPIETTRALTNIILKTYTYYCSESKTTLIINYEPNALCDKFLQHAGITGHFTMPFYLYQLNGDPFHGEFEGGKAELTILFVLGYNMSYLDNAWREIEEVPLYQSFSKYLFVFVPKAPNETDWIEVLFKFLWSKKILRVFVTFWKEELKVYTFNPFSGEYLKDVTNLTDKQKKVALEFELFDLKGYPMNVYIMDRDTYKTRMDEIVNYKGGIEYIGYDGKLLTQVRNILNVTIIFDKESENHHFMTMAAKYNESALFYDIFMKKYKVDIIFTASRSKGNTNVDQIFLHERDDYVILVPTGEQIPESLLIFSIIPANLLVLTLFHMLAVSLTLYLIRNINYSKNNQLIDSFYDIYKIIVNIPMGRHNKVFQERLILCVWIIYSILFSVVFSSSMVSTLVVPKYYDTIETIEDLVRTNLTVYTTDYEYGLVKKALTGSDVNLLKKLEGTRDVNFSTNIYSYQNYSGFMMRYERAREFLKVTKKIGKIRYNIMNEHPLPNAQSYQMPKGHPYLEEIQWIVHKVHESGLWYEWRKYDYGRENISTNPVDPEDTASENINMFLRLNHLQSVFYLLAFGHFIAFIIFSVEYLSQRTNAFNRKYQMKHWIKK